MVDQQEINKWLHEGIEAAKTDQFAYARSRLLDVVEKDQTNEVAWFWLYQVSDYQDDRRICLENLITINPNNQWAKQELTTYLTASAPQPPPPPTVEPPAAAVSDLVSLTTARLITAFWAGISFFLLTGGIIACSEWFVSGLRSRTLPYQVTLIQLVELMAALAFLGLGMMGAIVTVGLFYRTNVGFYGSLLFALGLLLLGPVLSMMITPTNYLAMVCTGGAAGVIVLLTLASLAEFK